MGRQKAIRFESNITQENVIQEGKPLYEKVKGLWNKEVFKNSNPIVLELGCGKGEYTVGLAKLFPDKNFIGIDIKGDRIAVGSIKATEANLYNVAFLRTKVHGLESFFNENEVAEIWITFPDPQVLQSGERRRLTNPRFLEIYAKILAAGGCLHLKTDSESFFKYSVSMLQNFGVKELTKTEDLYNSDLNVRHYNIKTRFEEIFTAKGFNINYLYCYFS